MPEKFGRSATVHERPARCTDSKAAGAPAADGAATVAAVREAAATTRGAAATPATATGTTRAAATAIGPTVKNNLRFCIIAPDLTRLDKVR